MVGPDARALRPWFKDPESAQFTLHCREDSCLHHLHQGEEAQEIKSRCLIVASPREATTRGKINPFSLWSSWSTLLITVGVFCSFIGISEDHWLHQMV